MISQPYQPSIPSCNPKVPREDDQEDQDGEGSDAFNSEDEVMSTSGDEAVDVNALHNHRRTSHRGGTGGLNVEKVHDPTTAQEYWEDDDPFPTPEGQPSCIVAPTGFDPDADDVSSVSQSASQVVVATVHEEAPETGEDKKKKKT